MKRSMRISALVLALGFGGGMAAAAVDTAALIEELRAQGYEYFEVKTDDGTLKIEAVGGGQKIERTYDALTGLLLRQEVQPSDDEGQPTGSGSGGEGGEGGEGGSDGDDDDGDDDDGEDDDGDDNDGDDDDGEDDDSEDDDSEDDDSEDDDEGDDDSEDDDEGDDDEGDDDEDDDDR